MTIASAQSFIQRAVNDSELISELNSAADADAARKILANNDFDFSAEDFQAAYYNVLTWCQTHDQADAVKEIKQWWDLFTISFT